MVRVMTWRFFSAAAMILVVSVYLGAQGKPDFSGKWVAVDPVPAAGDAATGRGGRGAGFQQGFGPEFTAKQDAKTLTITRGGQTTPLIYKLDGSESKNTVTRDGQQREQIAKATWEGNTLVIVTMVTFQNNTREQRRVLTMEGRNLVIQQTNPGRNGGATIKVVYKNG
jgi:hypothetical protein